MNRIILATIFAVTATTVHAADWYLFTNASTENTLYYFDASSISRTKNTVTLWVKAVKRKSDPNSNGGVSAAERTVNFCKTHRAQVVSSVLYRENGDLAYSEKHPDPVYDVVPSSVGEEILLAACEPGFPRKKDSALYLNLKGNDPLGFSEFYFSEHDGKSDSSDSKQHDDSSYSAQWDA